MLHAIRHKDTDTYNTSLWQKWTLRQHSLEASKIKRKATLDSMTSDYPEPAEESLSQAWS